MCVPLLPDFIFVLFGFRPEYLISLNILGQKRVSVDCCCHHIICWQFRIMFFCMSLIKMASFFSDCHSFPSLASSSLKLLFFIFFRTKRLLNQTNRTKQHFLTTLGSVVRDFLSDTWWRLKQLYNLDATYRFLDKLFIFIYFSFCF